MRQTLRSKRAKHRVAGFTGLFQVSCAVAAFAADAGPKVPAGRDPGGFPVAIVGQGLDYTRDAIASRLARDGEGEIIGYDYIDDDRRPFDTIGATAMAEIVLSEGQATTLVPVRVDLSDLAAAARAIRYAADAPGKIVYVTETIADPGRLALLDAAARRFAHKMFVAPVTAITPARAPSAAEGLLLVAAAGGTARGADVAAPPDQGTLADAPNAAATGATARVAALAARLVAVEPELPPAALKARILGLAEPQATDRHLPAVITNPRRHFWLE